MATNFGLTTSTPPVNVIQSINYLLSSVNTINSAGNVNLGNVVQVASNNAIYSNVGIIGYVNGYMDIKYANSATGSSGFSSNSTMANYYGVYNNATNSESANPVDYQWTQVAGGFGTTRGLYYTTGGGNSISFQVASAPPSPYYQPVPDNIPIVLASISANLVVANSLANSSVTTNAIAQAAVTGYNIAANTITANNIQVGTLTANLFVAGTITAANSIQSVNATFGDPNSAGYWLDSNTGNATFGGQLNVGANLVVAGLINNSSLANNTVNTQNINLNAVTSTSASANKTGSILIGLTANSAARGYWPVNTRGVIVAASVPTVANSTVVVNYSTSMYADANSSSNCVELWKYTGNTSSTYDRILKRVVSTGSTNPDFYVAGAYGTRLVANNITTASPFASYNDAYSVLNNYNIVTTGNTTVSQTISPQFQVYGSLPTGNVLVGSGGLIMTTGANLNYGTAQTNISTAGTSTILGTLQDFYAITESPNGILMVVGQDASIMVNEGAGTGNNWIAGDLFGEIANGVNFNAVNWWPSGVGGSPYWFIIVGDGGTIVTWLPGDNFNSVASPTTYNLRGVCWDSTNNRLLAVGDNGTILYSTSITQSGGVINISWASISSGTTRNLYSIDYNAARNYWVAVGQGITIAGQGTTVNPASGTQTQTWGNVFVNTDIQRVTYFGSYPYVGQTTPTPPVQQQINNQIVAGTYIDSNPTANATYYLVGGNLTGNANVYAYNPSLTITLQKR